MAESSVAVGGGGSKPNQPGKEVRPTALALRMGFLCRIRWVCQVRVSMLEPILERRTNLGTVICQYFCPGRWGCHSPHSKLPLLSPIPGAPLARTARWPRCFQPRRLTRPQCSSPLLPCWPAQARGFQGYLEQQRLWGWGPLGLLHAPPPPVNNFFKSGSP